MKLNADKLKKINWRDFFKKHKYAVISVMVFIIYFYAVFSAISFLIKNMGSAFNVDESSVSSQIVKFDMEGYEEIRERFNLE